MKLTAKRNIVFLFLVILFISLFFRYAHRAPKRNYCDFRVYYATAQRFLDKEDIYSRPDEGITPFKYSPTFALITSPLAFMPQKQASLLFFSLSFMLLILICIISKKMIVASNLQFGESFIFYFFPILFSSRFIFSVLDSGQITIMIFALLVFGMYLLQKKKDIAASALFALAVMFKYTAIIFLPYFIFRKRIKAATFMVMFLIFYCFVPALYAGFTLNLQYLKSWLPSIIKTSLDTGSWYDSKNQSIYSFILRLFGADSPFKHFVNLTFNQALILSAAIGAIIYLFIIIKKRNTNTEIIDYGLLLLCAALFNPNAWLANFVFFVFVYMVIINYLLNIKFSAEGGSASGGKNKPVLILTFFSFVLSSWAAESVVGDRLQNFFEALSTVTIAAFILVGILFYLKFNKHIFEPKKYSLGE